MPWNAAKSSLRTPFTSKVLIISVRRTTSILYSFSQILVLRTPSIYQCPILSLSGSFFDDQPLHTDRPTIYRSLFLGRVSELCIPSSSYTFGITLPKTSVDITFLIALSNLTGRTLVLVGLLNFLLIGTISAVCTSSIVHSI